jgi:lysophospholipase L1-like esterase
MVSIYLVVSFDTNSLTKQSLESSPGQSVKIVMLGDSITFRTNWNVLLDRNDVVNKGINGDTTARFIIRLDSVIRLKPVLCFIMGGINDISLGISNPEIFENYVLIIHKLKASNIKPVIQSTLYISDALYDSKKINQKVSDLNRQLAVFAKQNDIDFIDVNGRLSGKTGLMADFTNDGLHLSPSGYRAWKEVLIPYLNKLNFQSGQFPPFQSGEISRFEQTI